MSIETELLDLARKYVASELALVDVYMWVQDRQIAIAELPDESIAAQVAGSIMLAEVDEFENGTPADDVRRWLANEHPELSRSASHS